MGLRASASCGGLRGDKFAGFRRRGALLNRKVTSISELIEGVSCIEFFMPHLHIRL